MDVTFASLVVFLCVGITVGILSGLLGVGGGTILVPVFKLAFGMPALGATATSMFTIIPTSITGVVTHLRRGSCVLRFGLAAGIGGALTSPVGVWLASISSDWMTMVAAAAVIAYSSMTMLTKAFGLLKREHAAAHGPAEDVTDVAADAARAERDAVVRAAEAECVDEAASAYVVPGGAKPIACAGAIGLVAGVLSGYVGLGGGFLIIPLFMQLLGMPMKMTSGTSLISVLLLAIPGTVMQALLGNVNWVVGICVAAGAIPGAVIGSKLLKHVPELALRFIFGSFLLVASVLLVIDQL